mmetsp:Transcript_55963/g.108009  ORF Transcript_55963/g.108009 Transcript_55963/m.108009 type:complete len:256 (-) Transcript_55963:1754-2521(-)
MAAAATKSSGATTAAPDAEEHACSMEAEEVTEASAGRQAGEQAASTRSPTGRYEVTSPGHPELLPLLTEYLKDTVAKLPLVGRQFVRVHSKDCLSVGRLHIRRLHDSAELHGRPTRALGSNLMQGDQHCSEFLAVLPCLHSCPHASLVLVFLVRPRHTAKEITNVVVVVVVAGLRWRRCGFRWYAGPVEIEAEEVIIWLVLVRGRRRIVVVFVVVAAAATVVVLCAVAPSWAFQGQAHRSESVMRSHQASDLLVH